MGAFVVPGLVAVAGFHCRDDLNQAGMVAAAGQHSGDDVFLAVVALGKVLDGHARGMITMSTSANGWVPNMPDGHRIRCHSGAGGAKIPIGSA